VKNEPILVIFGIQNSKEMSQDYNYIPSPVKCSHYYVHLMASFSDTVHGAIKQLSSCHFRTTWVSWYQKGKLVWILMKQEMMGWYWH